MKQIKNINSKIKKAFYNNIVQSVLVSSMVMIIITVLAFLIFWSHRMEIVNFLVEEYRAQQKTETKIEIPSIEDVKEEPQAPKVKEVKEKVPTVVDAVKKARPAVVSIVIKSGSTGKQIGSGSGFLISSDGLIVTNRHVVAQEDANFTVLLNDGMEYTAQVLDRDPVLDVALVKIAGSNFPYLDLADSNTLEVGETVIAIGNALGEFKNSVSVGVVSGLSRSITAGDNYGQTEYLDKVIQTDAAINKGNSGGPLLNIKAEVVGINVAMVEGSSSIGFSLPINSVKAVISSVQLTGKITRPYVGVRYIPIIPDMKLPYSYGILIEKGQNEGDVAVIPNSPAMKAGLKEGDIILEIDGEKATIDKNFSYLIRGKKVGDFVTMKIYSNGVLKTVVVVLEQAPSNL